jgi:ribosome biogenesis GTPase
MQGKIIKGIGGFYYVHNGNDAIYECRAKGIFRNRKMKPLVGDIVEIEILNEEAKEGNLVEIYPRENTMIRPAVSNVNQALLFFAATNPNPNYILLDKLMIQMEYQNVPVSMCFNKCDLISKEERQAIYEIYKDACQVFFISVQESEGLNQIQEFLSGKTTVLAGPSGVGKSSLLNALKPDAKAQTGTLSEKLGRGKHTTRHSELFFLKSDTYLMDTPGFSSLDLPDLSVEDLKLYYPEFTNWNEQCRFHGCVHIHEPDCLVKEAVERQEIAKERYESYCYLYEELKQSKKTYGKKR